MGQQVSRRVLWPRKGNIFSSNEKKTTLKIYFKKTGCVGYHHLDEKRKEFQSNFIVNNINNNNKVAYWYTPYCISNLISRNLKEKKKKSHFDWTKYPHKNNITVNISVGIFPTCYSTCFLTSSKCWKNCNSLWKLAEESVVGIVSFRDETFNLRCALCSSTFKRCETTC